MLERMAAGSENYGYEIRMKMFDYHHEIKNKIRLHKQKNTRTCKTTIKLFVYSYLQLWISKLNIKKHTYCSKVKEVFDVKTLDV